MYKLETVGWILRPRSPIVHSDSLITAEQGVFLTRVWQHATGRVGQELGLDTIVRFEQRGVEGVQEDPGWCWFSAGVGAPARTGVRIRDVPKSQLLRAQEIFGDTYSARAVGELAVGRHILTADLYPQFHPLSLDALGSDLAEQWRPLAQLMAAEESSLVRRP